MLDGFYTLRFQSAAGEGGGVLVLRDGTALGGDSMMYYRGTYHETEDGFAADLEFVTHCRVPGMVSTLGVENAPLTAQGRQQDDGSFLGQATSPLAPGKALNFTMQKVG